LLTRRAADYFGMSGPSEFIVAVALFALLIVLKFISPFHHSFDSDEPQHLHVVWSWTRGLVQYRDIFDNHMPLFHIMFAPVAALIGERATILYWMRLLMLPLYFVAAWATWQIGTHVFSRRVGFWSVIAVGSFPSYHFNVLEFRTDNLWAPLWLLCLTVLFRGAISVRRALVAGLLLGLCFATSMKSILFLISLALSAPLAFALVGRNKLGLSSTHLAWCAAAFLATTFLIPVAIIVFFALEGVRHDFLYCVFGHQFFPRLYGAKQVISAIISLIVFPLVFFVTRRVAAGCADPQIAVRRAFILLVTASYFFALRSLWPLISRDDYLPFLPLAFVLLTASLFALPEWLTSSGWNINWVFRLVPMPGFVALAELVVLMQMREFLKDNTRDETEMLRNVLKLTTPADYVFDCKGETVFRRRCFRPVIETITRKRIQYGLMPDTASQQCIETRTCVVATTELDSLTPSTRQFMDRNYLPVADNLRVAGAELRPSITNPQRCYFDVVIPSYYKIVSDDENVLGTLDGTPYDGARFLTAGPHTFESTSTPKHFVLLWAQAADRHFMPLRHGTSPDS
jgi:hypothetical protein